MFLRKIFNLTNLTLVTALTLSVIAAWYSILGLVAIFSAAAIPIIIMGTALEVSKVVTTVWLHAYWDKVKWSMRTYLVVAVILLAFLTSMGIFGFLSKAHSDQSLVSGDVQSKIALYDEKIKIAKENIDANRRALKQLDEAVDQVMGRSTSEQGAERSVQIRRQQAPERQRLLREIEAEQKKITSLNEERAPIAAEVRKVEAEVGPIKYIAAMIYGDDPDSNLLERAVRWVIILIVFVFDPLALTLVLAANESRRWDKQRPKEEIIPIIKEPDPEPIESDPIDESPKVPDKAYEEPIQEEKPKVEQTYLNKPWVDKVPNIERVGPQVYKPDIVTEDKGNYEVLTCSKCGSNLEFIVGFGNFCTNKNCDIGDYVIPNDTELPIVEEPKILAKTTITPEVVEEIKVEPVIEEVKVDKVKVAEVKPDIKTEGVTRLKPYKELDSGYIVIEGKGSFQKEAAKSLYPEMFMLTADSSTQISTNFGTEFPRVSNKGDVFVRVDILPNKVFKFDGIKWIEMVKKSSHSYLYDKEYIKHLIKQIENGSYDVELLTDYEREMIEDYLKNQNT
jgi:hypothetical protein